MHYFDRRRQQRRERDIMLALRDILARMSQAQDQDVQVPPDAGTALLCADGSTHRSSDWLDSEQEVSLWPY